MYTNLDTNGNQIQSDILAFAPRQIVADSAQDIIIKRSAGIVVFLHCATEGVSVTVIDGDKQVWPTLTGIDQDDFSNFPLQFGTSIVLRFSGAGTAHIAYR
ncbi:MAG: hypothetical protein ACYDEJ_03260 [Desulfitobacteriaceae bacterium]